MLFVVCLALMTIFSSVRLYNSLFYFATAKKVKFIGFVNFTFYVTLYRTRTRRYFQMLVSHRMCSDESAGLRRTINLIERCYAKKLSSIHKDLSLSTFEIV